MVRTIMLGLGLGQMLDPGIVRTRDALLDSSVRHASCTVY